ncbi:MAG: 4-(cytidine 5'-diphospho)-2-C-methyl-D-erythritol kinase [Pseudomonadota bacterium]
MTTVDVFAPAKVNLTLHITGRRPDGYHLIDSLVAFGPAGDFLKVKDGAQASLRVDGPEADGVPTNAANLALQAFLALRRDAGVELQLTKHLPAASGIGGGSADAAAAVRAALAMEDPAASTFAAFGPDALLETKFRPLLDLGADIPMCLLPRPLRARGIGEKVEFAKLPPLITLLVNPRVPVPTGDVFAALDTPDNPPMPDILPEFADASSLIDWLSGQRNDLQAAALTVAPAIGDVLCVLNNSPGCGLARMSGSGATCFGLFANEEDAMAAGNAIQANHPDWWLAGGMMGDYLEKAMPLIT